MKENVLDILIYLFEHYMVENQTQEADEETLMADLLRAGFRHGTINRALDWLDTLAGMCDLPNEEVRHPRSTSHRIYTADERDQIGHEAIGLLRSLENNGVITPHIREVVIDRVSALEEHEIELDHIKWVTLMVLTNYNQELEFDVDLAEQLILHSLHGSAH